MANVGQVTVDVRLALDEAGLNHFAKGMEYLEVANTMGLPHRVVCEKIQAAQAEFAKAAVHLKPVTKGS